MKAHLTQIEIATKVGISQSYVSDLLNGVKTPSAQMAERLEQATGFHRLFWLYPKQFTKRGKKLTASPNTPTEREGENG